MHDRRRLPLACALAIAVVSLALPSARISGAGAQDVPPAVQQPTIGTATTPILWRRSFALGAPWSGSLLNGVRLPPEGDHWFSWDFVSRRAPNRGSRLWGTDYLLRKVLRVCRQYREASLDAPRCAVGDVSRPRGGDFGPQFGGIGHRSHQNGLDADIYYPRLDRRERAPLRVGQIDVALSQELVDRFVAAGADYVFVGPNTGLTGPPGVVQPLAHHDNHLHVRFPNRRRL